MLSFLLVLFCLEKWFQVKIKLMEFVLKISEPKPRPWASKNSHSKEQEMKIILSTFNPSTPETRWSWNWRLCDGLHWSLLNQSAAILNLLKWSRRLFLSDVLSEDSQAESAIFQESFHQASSPNVRSESNLEEKPNR